MESTPQKDGMDWARHFTADQMKAMIILGFDDPQMVYDMKMRQARINKANDWQKITGIRDIEYDPEEDAITIETKKEKYWFYLSKPSN